MPSIFGENQCSFIKKDDMKICRDKQIFFHEIKDEIINKIIKRQRSGLICFENKESLLEYKQYLKQSNYNDPIGEITEEASE